MTVPTVSLAHSVVPIEGEKFGVLFDWDMLEVPDHYVHSTWLDTFFRSENRKFKLFDRAINDRNFGNPSRIMLPGERFRVRAFAQAGIGMTSTKERLDFLTRQGVVFTGAQGLTLVFSLLGGKLPKGKHYTALDFADRLYQHPHLPPQVPDLNHRCDGALFFDLDNFTADWYGGNVMIGFNEII